MNAHRFEIDAQPGPGRERVSHGRCQLLVRVRLFDGPSVSATDTGEPSLEPDVFCDLRPEQARDLALGLLVAATDAERHTRQTDWFRR
jgi:hypothetical protein